MAAWRWHQEEEAVSCLAERSFLQLDRLPGNLQTSPDRTLGTGGGRNGNGQAGDGEFAPRQLRGTLICPFHFAIWLDWVIVRTDATLRIPTSFFFVYLEIPLPAPQLCILDLTATTVPGEVPPNQLPPPTRLHWGVLG